MITTCFFSLVKSTWGLVFSKVLKTETVMVMHDKRRNLFLTDGHHNKIFISNPKDKSDLSKNTPKHHFNAI